MKSNFVYKRLIILAVLYLCSQNNLNAQDSLYQVKIKQLAFNNKTIDVPQFYSIQRNDTVYLETINENIIKRFEIIPDAPKNEIDYDQFVGTLRFYEDYSGYLDIKYSYNIKSNFIEINIEGNYAEFEGKPMFEIFKIYKKDTFYIDIINNELFDATGYYNGIKLKYFFEPKEYLELLSKTWIPKIQEIQKKYPDNIEYEYSCDDCSSINASLHAFGYEYEIQEDSLFIFLESPAYFRDLCYRSFCSSQLEIAYPIKYAKQLFKKEFDILKFNQLNKFSRIVYYKDHLENKFKETRLISGKIDGKYPFLMALDIDNKNNIYGYYKYTSKPDFIELRGNILGANNIELVEYVNNESTGKFEIVYKGNLTSQYEIKDFKWHSPDLKKSYKIEVDDFDIY